MMYLKHTDGVLQQYPYALSDFKRDHPNVSPPNNMDALAEFGVAPVVDLGAPNPSDPLAFEVIPVDPALVNGEWVVQYTEIPLDPVVIEKRAKVAAQREVEDQARADAFIQQFVQYNAQQVQDYIDNNMNNLNQARAIIKKLALICLALAKTRLS